MVDNGSRKRQHNNRCQPLQTQTSTCCSLPVGHVRLFLLLVSCEWWRKKFVCGFNFRNHQSSSPSLSRSNRAKPSTCPRRLMHSCGKGRLCSLVCLESWWCPKPRVARSGRRDVCLASYRPTQFPLGGSLPGSDKLVRSTLAASAAFGPRLNASVGRVGCRHRPKWRQNCSNFSLLHHHFDRANLKKSAKSSRPEWSNIVRGRKSCLLV